jgi:hypothetical protein
MKTKKCFFLSGLRGHEHIWTGAIVAVLAIVIMGVIAYSSVQAADQGSGNVSIKILDQKMTDVVKKLNAMDQKLNKIAEQTRFCNATGTHPVPPSSPPPEGMSSSTPPTPPKAPKS